MKRGRWLATAALGAAWVLATAVPPATAAGAVDARDISGRYLSKGDTTKSVTLAVLAGDVYRSIGDGWEGVGMFDGATYWGVFRLDGDPAPERRGTHRGALRPDGSLAVHGEFAGGKGKPFDVIWTPDRASAMRPRPTPPSPPTEPRIVPKPAPQDGDRLPEIGDYVYVEELPEALTKVRPVYPDLARQAGVEGVVMVQALVGRDGRVADTKIVKSIPLLDEAAVRAVRQWVFKPAAAGGKPVAVWVAVPVQFPPP